ncbi:hypothetical protein [Bacteroides sp.]
MGNFDYKNICLQIKTRENFTDPRFVEFMKGWNFTEKEYDVFLDTVWNSMSNEYSKRIVDFFVSYKEGILLPDRCGPYEPLGYNFNKDDISAPIRWLSAPAGALLLKKKYKYTAEVKNDYYAIILSDGKAVVPKRVLTDYLGKIIFWFSKQRKIDMVFLEQLLRDLCSYLNADNGIIFDQETNEVLLDIFQ